jgi:hypothetical protein
VSCAHGNVNEEAILAFSLTEQQKPVCPKNLLASSTYLKRRSCIVRLACGGRRDPRWSRLPLGHSEKK